VDQIFLDLSNNVFQSMAHARSQRAFLFLIPEQISHNRPMQDNQSFVIDELKMPKPHQFNLLMLLLLSFSATAQFGVNDGFVNTNAVQSLHLLVSRADNAYQKQNYKTAFNLYQILSKQAWDQFSQYRIAYMYANGQHVRQNYIMAYAWSTLAAETGIPELKQYNLLIADKIDEKDLAKAKDIANRLIREYGVFQQAMASSKMLRKEKFSCTGSRVGNSCSRISSSGPSCNIAADRPPPPKCLRMGRLGLNSVAGTFPLRLKRAEQHLELLMQEFNPGKVELRDLELLEDEVNDDDDSEMNVPELVDEAPSGTDRDH